MPSARVSLAKREIVFTTVEEQGGAAPACSFLQGPSAYGNSLILKMLINFTGDPDCAFGGTSRAFVSPGCGLASALTPSPWELSDC
jgi:hypothetical protein